VAEDLGQEDVIGLVTGFEAVAADGGVGAAQVAWFPGLVQRAEGVCQRQRMISRQAEELWDLFSRGSLTWLGSLT